MFSLKFSFLLILNVHYGQQSKQPIIIECGLKYLPNTIGLSTVGDQLYQFIILNETISFIKYSNQYERLQAKSTKQSKNENENDYRHTIDLSDGEYYNFDEIIYSDDEREKILYFLHYEHNQQDYHIRLENLSKNYNSLLLLGNDRHMRFLLYETTFLYNHYIIECDLFRSKSARYIKNYKYQTEMLIISDGESKTIAITNQLNDYLFSIETIFESTEEPMKRLFYFYIDSRQPKQFVSTANVQTIKLSDENYSRKKMKELFAKHQYRYGFIQKFTFTIDDDNDNHQNNTKSSPPPIIIQIIIKIAVCMFFVDEMMLYNVKFSSLLSSILFFVILNSSSNDYCVYGQQQDQSRNIECGVKYLPNTIGISMVNNQIYQIINENNTNNIKIIIYDNKNQRIEGISSDKNDEKIHYKLNLSNGYYKKFNEIIAEENEREKLLTLIRFEHNQYNKIVEKDEISEQYNAIITINNKNNKLTLTFYETTFLEKHYIIVYDDNNNNDDEKIQTKLIQFNNLAELIMINNDYNSSIKLSYLINDYVIRIETRNNNKDFNHFLYCNQSILNEFSSTIYRYRDYEHTKEFQYSKMEIEKHFSNYQFRYGFIQKFKNIYGNKKQEKYILFLFSNKQEKILYFNIGDLYMDEADKHFPFFHQNYKDFFHCNIDKTNDNNNNPNKPNKDIFNFDINLPKPRIPKKFFTKSKLIIYIIIISMIIIFIIFPLLSIILMICYYYGYCQYNQSRIIDCGIEYLPNTIGLSMVGDQIYQIIKKNDILQIIIYNNKQKRLKGRSKKQIENDNQKIINYKMDLSNGYIYYFDEQIIIEKNIHKLLFDELYYEHDPNNDEQIIKTEKLSEKFNAIIIITNNNNDNDKNQIKFILYETSYLSKHFVIVYDSSQTNETKQLQKFIMSFENIPAEMIVISDNELSIVISYIMTANAITIEKKMKKKERQQKSRSKKQIENDDNNQKIINYKMDLSNGYIYYFDEQIIIEKNIHKLLFDELYYEHDPNNDEQIIKTEKLSEKFNAIIIITNNNNDDKNQIKFILYETSYLSKHFVIVYDSSQTNETKQLQKFIMSFENIPAEMIVISDNELSIVISYIMTANAITIETIMEEPILKFFLYLNYSQPEKFVSSNERLTIPELSEESEHSRINIQNVFVQHKFRYGFIEKFSFPTTSVIIDDNGNRKTMNEEEYIAFLFSNEKKKLLTFNIGDVMLKEQNVVSYFHYNYNDFFHCNDSLSKKENKNKNKDKNDDNKNDHQHQDNVTEKILTTTTTKKDNSIKSKSTTIIIYMSIIIIIIISSIILINSCNNSNNNNSKQKKLQQPNSTSSSPHHQ
ncbi:hypothetical protein DERP_004208 [Dermatophagoides pteronyssinus]|uniref:Uncharacterized protein n=1 Tax=Dermatophagoides pteronyssinus TaxID=6956 RepID=A0ABQ8J8F5_DERPT|nr:hypothetical protein DERP_004208 [Dermatophagoides pteronyssinus]